MLLRMLQAFNFESSEKVDFGNFGQHSSCFSGGKFLELFALWFQKLTSCQFFTKQGILVQWESAMHMPCVLFFCLMVSLLLCVFDVLTWPQGRVKSTGYCKPLVTTRTWWEVSRMHCRPKSMWACWISFSSCHQSSSFSVCPTLYVSCEEVNPSFP